MFCIKCFSDNTKVINSRPSRKVPRIWRRRSCMTCGYTFTTHEMIADDEYVTIEGTPLSIARLAFSIAECLPVADVRRADNAFWLARTVGERLLSTRQPSASVKELLTCTHEVLQAYDPAAGIQYGLRHGITRATAAPRRGRPRFKNL